MAPVSFEDIKVVSGAAVQQVVAGAAV